MTKPPRKPAKPLLGEAEAPLRSRPRRRRDPAQPNLPLDPMPARVEPCLALLKRRPPKGDDWIYEIKWDGYRLAVHIEPATDTGRKRNAVFVRPELVAEIEYRAWTHDGKLRHASYKGLREIPISRRREWHQGLARGRGSWSRSLTG